MSVRLGSPVSESWYARSVSSSVSAALDRRSAVCPVRVVSAARAASGMGPSQLTVSMPSIWSRTVSGSESVVACRAADSAPAPATVSSAPPGRSSATDARTGPLPANSSTATCAATEWISARSVAACSRLLAVVSSRSWRIVWSCRSRLTAKRWLIIARLAAPIIVPSACGTACVTPRATAEPITMIMYRPVRAMTSRQLPYRERKLSARKKTK
nr:hypothetical protein GCM10020092_037030 [Actinoplanes digitatis]